MNNFNNFLLEANRKDILDLYKGKKEDFEISLNKLKYRNKIFDFNVKSKSGNSYIISLKLDEYGVISRMKDPTSRKLDLTIEDNIHVHCTCPSFLYWGYQWIGTQLDYSLKAENREPNIRNPKQEGSCCKHLHYFLSNIDKYKPEMITSLEDAKHHKWTKGFPYK